MHRRMEMFAPQVGKPTDDMPPCVVDFLLPENREVFDTLPSTIAEYWQWQHTTAEITPYWGRYHWVLQTYLYLKEAGLPVRLCSEMPPRGIIVTHLDCVDYAYRPTADQYLVVMLVDREVPHPRARLHITHNPCQQLSLGLRYRYMPPWTQIALIPRDPERGSRFQTLGYFGYPNNLTAEILADDFQQRLHGLGIRMFVPPPSAWHDFSQVDCIMAIRNYGRDNRHLNKPSLKLLNAWLAGVPAVLGYESAYRHDGHPGEGYLEATTADELFEAVERLSNDPSIRQALVNYGHGAIRQFAVESNVERWRRLLEDHIVPAFESRRAGPIDECVFGIAGALRESVLWRRPGWF